MKLTNILTFLLLFLSVKFIIADFNLTTCFPFTDVGTTALLNSAKKVYAHYFSLFLISIDNEPSATDYYELGWIDPNGEGGIHYGYGGFIRQRPMPRPVRSQSNWLDLDAQLEVTNALALGLDGFTYNMLSDVETDDHWLQLIRLMTNAPLVDPRFKIVLMPDMLSGWTNADDIDDTFVATIKKLWTHPANATLQRDCEGALVLSPYRAESKSPEWWLDQFNRFAVEGIQIAFWPVFEDVTPSNYQSYAALSTVQSEWDGNCVSSAPGFISASNYLQSRGEKYMSPIMSQNHRPKDFTSWESSNSGAIRAMWNAAISSGASKIQIITWNDYSEGSELAPSSGSKYSFYDVSAYYLRWFKLGSAPAITRDALYYFHRNSLSTQAPDLTKQSQVFTIGMCDTVSDKVEALVFLTSSATVEIIQNGQTYSQTVAAGVQSVKTNLLAGATPQFKVIRGSTTVINITSAVTVKTSVQWQDLLYRGGGSLTCTRPTI
ncbi:hypothetical protein DLAC_08977 [Tieghemostelium lacteum]|uniref:Glycoside hydrolase family 71 protein n=1 Tax=Tieghemostelium lacteum TaxID=361077 RepID=A0A151Z8V7_TIELA|nr:hypothetical protein DLAC_08977 [Tieghemostelium lacteum]|eukprot:KYQ90361.1 hypothetical protein DLAC_08977 [Tieghemostelium lacteum]